MESPVFKKHKLFQNLQESRVWISEFKLKIPLFITKNSLGSLELSINSPGKKEIFAAAFHF
jgi:hypothetical protein